MKKSLIFIAAVAAMACACSKSEVVMEQSPAKGICFKTSVSAVKGAVFDGAHLSGKYAIYAAATQRDKAGAVTVGSYFGETKFIATADAPTLYIPETAPIYWPVGDCTMDFLAFAIDSTKHGDVPATWPTSVSANGVRFDAWDTYTNQADLLYACENEVNPTTEAVALEFKHAQAAIAFTAKADIAGQVFLDSILVDGLQTKGNFVIDNSKVKFVAGWESLETSDTASVIKNVAPSEFGIQLQTTPLAVGDTLLIPQQSKKLIKVVYHFYGDDEKYSRTFNNDFRGAWEMGKKYIYNISLSFKTISFTETVVPYTTETTPAEI